MSNDDVDGDEDAYRGAHMHAQRHTACRILKAIGEHMLYYADPLANGERNGLPWQILVFECFLSMIDSTLPYTF